MEQITVTQLFAFIIGFGGVVSLVYAFIVWVKDPKKIDKQKEEDTNQKVQKIYTQYKGRFGAVMN